MQPASGKKVQKKKPDPPKAVSEFQDPDSGQVEQRLNRQAKSDRRDNYGQITVLDMAAQQGAPFVSPASVDCIGQQNPPAPPIPYPVLGSAPPSSVSTAPTVPPSQTTFAQSTGDEAGSQKGVVSSTSKSKAPFTQGSTDVKMEGDQVHKPRSSFQE